MSKRKEMPIREATPSELEMGEDLRQRLNQVINDFPVDNDLRFSLAMTVLSEMILYALYDLSDGDYDLMRQRMVELVNAHERILRPGMRPQ